MISAAHNVIYYLFYHHDDLTKSQDSEDKKSILLQNQNKSLETTPIKLQTAPAPAPPIVPQAAAAVAVRALRSNQPNAENPSLGLLISPYNVLSSNCCRSFSFLSRSLS